MDNEGISVQSARPRCRLVVGLGNPGAEYALTRHNAGWQVADAFLAQASARKPSPWQPREGELWEAAFPEEAEILVLKPLTFMNASGTAVAEVLRHFAYSPGEMLVVCDCLDLPVGRLRLRFGGSSGGQRGVQSIADELGTLAFPRLRMGIGRPEFADADIVEYVLGQWTSAAEPIRRQAVEASCRGLRILLGKGFAAAQEACNSWRAEVGEVADAVQTKL